MKIVIVGIGLIGGSFARAIKGLHPSWTLLGRDKTTLHLEKAISMGLVEAAATDDDVSEADLVLVCIPVNHLVEELPQILNGVKEDALVCDMGSTKALICQTLDAHNKRRNFLACHPIAGTEFTGPEAAQEDLFKGKTNIICEVEKTAFKLQERALDLFRELGMRIRYMNPEAHDRHIAYVSHLSHISSFMLGKTVMEKEKNERDIFDMAGSGFESTVRLAKSSPAMWTPIFQQNRANVLETLSEYINNLKAFQQLLEAEEFNSIFQEMEQTNRIKEILKGIPQN